MDEYKGDPQKKLDNDHSTVTLEAKQSSHISEASLIDLNFKTLKSLLTLLPIRSYPNPTQFSDDTGMI